MSDSRRSANREGFAGAVQERDGRVLQRKQCPVPLIALFVGLFLVGACRPTSQPAAAPREVPVTAIPLAGPIAGASAEVSGMAWYDEFLVLLPQYPGRFEGGEDGAFFALAKADLLAFLDGEREAPLEPIPIPFSAPGLAEGIPDFEGYEAIVFWDDRVYLTIEASAGTGMQGYLVSGKISPDLLWLSIDTGSRVEIPLQAGVANHSDEAILVAGDGLLTFYEANGENINPDPVAHRFDANLAPAGTVPFVQVEYRLTDVTALDSQGRFWAINYFFPGDEKLQPDGDPLAERYGQGPSHARYEQVERLLEFKYEPAAIRLVERSPLQLELPSDEARNWEGIARLDGRGFLLVTDKFPGTILGFVPGP
jgi:hypothetical protein